ncbi:hypothetical protein Tco_1531635 [Tanacetum coccineum]
MIPTRDQLKDLEALLSSVLRGFQVYKWMIDALKQSSLTIIFLILASSPTMVFEVKRVMVCLDLKICAKEKNFSSICAYTTMMLPRVRNHHGGKCVRGRIVVGFLACSLRTDNHRRPQLLLALYSIEAVLDGVVDVFFY